MTERPDKIALFDLDGTLCDYEGALKTSMEQLQSPGEIYAGIPRKNAPAYITARRKLICSNSEWWATLPKFKLGFDMWDLAEKLGFRRMILTQGPRLFPVAWIGKKLWIDRNLGQDTDITITRDKGLVYGKVLVDDWPEYIREWLKWRPRGLVIMPANNANIEYKHPQVIRYDGSNYEEVKCAMKGITFKKEG